MKKFSVSVSVVVETNGDAGSAVTTVLGNLTGLPLSGLSVYGLDEALEAPATPATPATGWIAEVPTSETEPADEEPEKPKRTRKKRQPKKEVEAPATESSVEQPGEQQVEVSGGSSNDEVEHLPTGEPEEITDQTLTEWLQKCIDAEKVPEARKLLHDFNAKKMSEVVQEDRPALVAKIGELLNV
jgi:hypothetical protein